MQYCRRHDLAFCEEHKGQCLSDQCKLTDNPRATFCSVCVGIIRTSNSTEIKHAEAFEAGATEATTAEDHTYPDPDFQV